MKERILIIGIGQAGGNLAHSFNQRKYNTLAINTSAIDLQSIDVPVKYHIPNATGCSKSIPLANEYAQKHYKNIINIIENNYSSCDICYICTSLSGGTGAGMTPFLADAYSTLFPNKKVNLVTIIPSKKESIKCKSNCIDTYKKIVELPNIRSVFMIDNNSRKDKLEINEEFVDMFDKIVNMSVPDPRGNIDINELEKLMVYKGNSIITRFETNKDNADDIELTNSIFAECGKDCDFIGTTVTSEDNMELIANEFNYSIDILPQYNNQDNIAIAVGMDFPHDYIEELILEVDEYNKKRESKVEKKLDVKDINTKVYEKEVKFEKIDIDALFAKYK